MREIRILEGKVVAPEGMKTAIVASRFNEIIVNKLLGGGRRLGTPRCRRRKYHGCLGTRRI